MRRILLITLLLAPLSLWAGNACTTTATGTDWGTASHWTSCGSTIPQPGDTVTIANATTLAAGQNADIGTSPAGCTGGSSCTHVLTINAALTINGTLVVRGSVNQGNAAVTFGPGSILEFNAASSASPATTTYAWLAAAYVRGNRMITGNGTSASHVIFRSNAGGGHGYFSAGSGFSDSLWFNCTYCDFQAVGDSTNDAIALNPSSDTTVNTLKNSAFDAASGRVMITMPPAAGGFDIEDCRFLQTNALMDGGYSARLPLKINPNNGATTGPRKLYRNVFINPPAIGPTGLDVQGNYFHNFFFISQAFPPYTWAAFTNNFARSTSVQTKPLGGSADNNYWLVDENTNGNPHFIAPADSITSGTVSFTNNIFEYTGGAYNTLPSNDWGDAVLLPNKAISLVVTGNIVLPNTPGTDTSGTLFTLFTTDTTFISVVSEHNTYPLSMKHSASLNEPNGGTSMSTGKVTFRSNLAWKPAGEVYAGTRCLVGDVANENNPANGPQDFLSVADYNAGFGADACYAGKGYNLKLSYTPGMHDVSGAAGGEQFVDSSRNLAKWAVSRGSAASTQAGKIADALTYLQADPTLTQSSLIPYVKVGFAPQNPALATAAHDGTTIGAVPYQAPAASGTRKRVIVVQ